MKNKSTLQQPLREKSKAKRAVTFSTCNCPRAYFACPEDVWLATRYFYPKKSKKEPRSRQQPPSFSVANVLTVLLQSLFRQWTPFPGEYSKSRQDGAIRSASSIYDTRGDNFMHATLHISFLLFFDTILCPNQADAFHRSTKCFALRVPSSSNLRRRRRSWSWTRGWDERTDNGRRNSDRSDKTNGGCWRYGTVIVPPRLPILLVFISEGKWRATINRTFYSCFLFLDFPWSSSLL